MAPLCGCVAENEVQLHSASWKNVFSSQTLPCGKNNTHFSLQESAGCLIGWLLFWEVGRFLACWLRKAFPLGLNVKKTLCCQSHTPTNHLTSMASCWKSITITKKIFGRFLFSYQGKITFTTSQKAFSLPIFPQEVTTQRMVFAVGNIQRNQA